MNSLIVGSGWDVSGVDGAERLGVPEWLPALVLFLSLRVRRLFRDTLVKLKLRASDIVGELSEESNWVAESMGLWLNRMARDINL